MNTIAITIKRSAAHLLLSSTVWLGVWHSAAQAQVTPASNDASTVVTLNGNTFDITGGTAAGTNLFHSFQTFGLNADQIANFRANPAIQNILGRVVGGDASVINGLIRVTASNANLYLMNPAGIVFGANARLDVAGSFTATTANGIGLGDRWFNAIGSNDYANLIGSPNSFAFTMVQPGSIINAGNLSVNAGQSITLLGGTVISTGTLTAPGGNITVAAVAGEKLVRISQDGSLLNLALPVDIGNAVNTLPFTPLTLPQLLTGGNLSNATGVAIENGAVKLTGSGVTVPTESGTAIVSNTMNVSGTSGGTVSVLGNKVGLIGANINASGTNGGGTVLIGGDYQGKGTVPNAQQTYVSPDSVIRVDALQTGNGGRAIVWSDRTTHFYGSVSARGGITKGDGGFAEVSGKQNLVFEGTTNLSAANGLPGLLLLDPENIVIVNGASGTGANDALLGNAAFTVFPFGTTDPGGTTVFSSGKLDSFTDLVVLSATNNIIVTTDLNLQASSIGFTAGGTFTLGVGNTIQMVRPNGAISIQANNINLGNLTTNGGIINLNGNVTLTENSTIRSVRTTGIGTGGTITIGQTTSNTLNGDIPGTRNLLVDAGTGTVVVNSAIGTTNRLNNLTLRGNAVTIAPNTSIRTTGELRVETQADLSFNNQSDLQTDGDLVLQSDGRVSLVNVNNLDLGVGRDLTIIGQSINLQSNVNAPRNLTVTVTGTSNTEVRGSLSAGQDLRFGTSGFLTLSTTLRATRDLTVQARAIALGSLDAGRNLQLQTQENLVLTGSQLRAGGNAEVRSLAGSITVNNATLTQPDLQGDLTLIANTNLTVRESRLQVPGNVRLQAGGTIDVRDGGDPAIVQSGGNLTIQGNTSINLEGYRDPDSQIQSGGNLTLISDGAIVANTRLISGGTITAQQVAGGAANLQQTVPSFNTILASIGDVTFGNYEGTSLKVETLGSINGGNITILGSNPFLTGTDPDIALLTNSSSLILRAGVSSLQNPPNLPPNQSIGGTNISQTANTSSPGNITVGAIQAGGSVILSAPGNVTTGSIATTPSNGFPAEVRISAGGNITARLNPDASLQSAPISALGSVSSGSGYPAVILSAGGNILTGAVRSEDGNRQGSVSLSSTAGGIQVDTIRAGSGGITVNAANFFRAVGYDIGVDSFSPGGVVNDPELIRFLVERGFSEEQLRIAPYSVAYSRFGNSTLTGNGVIVVNSDQRNYSLKVNIANADPDRAVINIRIGDAKQEILNQVVGRQGRVVILGDSRQLFRLGPNPNNDLSFVPDLASNRLGDYNPATNNFAFKWNASQPLIYPSQVFPLGTSGLAGAIAIDDGTNEKLVGSLQYRSFTPLDPIPEKPIIDVPRNGNSSADPLAALRQQFQGQDGEVAQRQLTAQAKDSTCGSSAIAAVPSGQRGGATDNTSSRATAGAATSAQADCNQSSDDSQILKLLEEAPGSSQNKQLDMDRLPTRAEAAHHIAPTR